MAEGEPVPTLASLLLATAQEIKPQDTKKSTSKATPPSISAPPFPLPPATLLQDTAATKYLSSLLDLPLPTLLGLPTTLSQLATSLDNDLSSLAFARYSAFLLSHKATQAINGDFNTLSTELAALLDSTEQLERAASNFESKVHTVRVKRERMARVRERMEEVEELLEAPSVVDACVRAGYWSEAIDVAARLAELHARLSASTSSAGKSADPDEGKGALRLLDGVREEVSLALLSLRARVLDSLLQRGLKLPAAVRGIGILRRMNGGGLGIASTSTLHGEMHEEALRIVFLAARWRCLKAELESVEGQLAACGIKMQAAEDGVSQTPIASPPDLDESALGVEENEERTRWVRRWIEIWREVVGETVGMYSEVFLSSAALPSQPDGDVFLPDTAPLSLFLSTSLSALSSTLTCALPAITSAASLSALLTQLSYCSHAFARHGLEFREVTQIRDRVEQRVGAVVVSQFVAAGRAWEKEWRLGWDGAVKKRGRQRLPFEAWLVVQEGLSSVLALPTPPVSPPPFIPQPNPALTLFPPLARLLNAHAQALNSLRLLPSRAIFSALADSQARELDRATKVLSAFVDALLGLETSVEEEGGIAATEKALLLIALRHYGRVLVPWCEAALRIGVYEELKIDQRHALVQEAVQRVEELVGRLEGTQSSVVNGIAAPSPFVDDAISAETNGSGGFHGAGQEAGEEVNVPSTADGDSVPIVEDL